MFSTRPWKATLCFSATFHRQHLTVMSKTKNKDHGRSDSNVVIAGGRGDKGNK